MRITNKIIQNKFHSSATISEINSVITRVFTDFYPRYSRIIFKQVKVGRLSRPTFTSDGSADR